ncbi:MAG TPA: trehalose-phosphatase, partial [Telmatospirillum sp.]|nr:trehalose-phosphatase [Telmatospirillum sp.]
TSGDLCWFPGKMVYEIKPRGYSKGTAVEAFMKTDPFRGRKPVFIGDDLPDEDGFEAVRTFGGLGILIGPHRSTKALFQFETVSALRIWLAELPL